MTDTFNGHKPGLEAPALHHYQIADGALDPVPRAIRCQADGTITLTDQTEPTGVALPYTMVRGEIMPGRFVHAAITSGTFYAEL